MKTIETTSGSKDHAGCLICGTTYHVGRHIHPQPKCKCGNIIFFDITPYYVRIGVDWPFIKVEDENNWKEIVLKELEQFGRPKYLTENPDEKDDMDVLDFEKRYDDI